TWHVINTSRIVFLNVLFLVLVYVLYITFLQPPELFRLKPKTTLVIRPYGNVVEQYTTTPLDRALQQAAGQDQTETRLRDILEAIHRAAGDKDIVQLVIDPNYMWGIGLAALKDIENAVDAFRSTGKPVIALAGNLTQNQYYLASLADEVWLNPNGVIFIDGYSNYRHFYREGLDKLAVEINLFRVGKYKSAMEPFIRDDMSPAAREAGKSWLGSLWQQYLEGVSKHRGILIESLQAAINDLPNRIEAAHGDFAQYALKLGLVDRLMTAPQARQALAQSGTPDQAGDSYRAVDMRDYLNLTKARTASSSAKHIAVIIAEGDIVNGRQPPGRIGTLSIAEQLRRVARDDKVAALVLRINSPGGDAYAAQAIRQEIQQVRDAGKKVVVSMGNVAASGGYMIAMAADEVWASPATITGSIGVFGMLPTFSGTLAKIGVHTDGFGTTDIAGKIRLDRPLDPSMARVLQAATERVYRQFVAMVKKARGIDTLAEVEAVAQGRVWSGQQAVDRRLVDKTGTFQDAIKAAARIAGLGNTYQLDWVEPERSALDQFFSDFVAKVVSRFDISVGQPTPVPSGWLQNMLRDLRYIASNEGSFTVAARCLCDIQ
ncbi:MAG: signal peptide peptidase SppA, partial [Lysobacterales bacterium]